MNTIINYFYILLLFGLSCKCYSQIKDINSLYSKFINDNTPSENNYLSVLNSQFFIDEDLLSEIKNEQENKIIDSILNQKFNHQINYSLNKIENEKLRIVKFEDVKFSCLPIESQTIFTYKLKTKLFFCEKNCKLFIKKNLFSNKKNLEKKSKKWWEHYHNSTKIEDESFTQISYPMISENGLFCVIELKEKTSVSNTSKIELYEKLNNNWTKKWTLYKTYSHNQKSISIGSEKCE